MQCCWHFLLLVVLVLGGCAAPVRGEDVEGQKVSRVTFRYAGPKSVEERRLRTFIGTTAGSAYESDRVDEDIKALYESGMANDVRVLVEPKRGGVEVIYEVTARQQMGPSPCAGNTVFSDERLSHESGLNAGAPIDRKSLSAASQKIEAYYRNHGYGQCKVGVKYDAWSADAPGDFQFVIEEGPASR